MSKPSPYDHLNLWQILPVYIGRIAQEWCEVEHQLAGLLARIGRIPPDYADIIIAAISSNRVHCDILANIAKASAMSGSNQEKLAALLRRCAKASRKRNTCVHALYFTRGEDRLLALRHVMEIVAPTSDQVIDQRWLDQTLEQICELAKDIFVFTESLGGSHALRPTTLKRGRAE